VELFPNRTIKERTKTMEYLDLACPKRISVFKVGDIFCSAPFFLVCNKKLSKSLRRLCYLKRFHLYRLASRNYRWIFIKCSVPLILQTSRTPTAWFLFQKLTYTFVMFERLRNEQFFTQTSAIYLWTVLFNNGPPGILLHTNVFISHCQLVLV